MVPLEGISEKKRSQLGNVLPANMYQYNHFKVNTIHNSYVNKEMEGIVANH